MSELPFTDEPYFQYIDSDDYFGLDVESPKVSERELSELLHYLFRLEYNFCQLFNGDESNSDYFVCNREDSGTVILSQVNNYISSVNAFRNCIKRIMSSKGLKIDICKENGTTPESIYKPCRIIIEMRNIIEHDSSRLYSFSNYNEEVYAYLKKDSYINSNTDLSKKKAQNTLYKNSDISLPDLFCKFHNRTRYLIRQVSSSHQNRFGGFGID